MTRVQSTHRLEMRMTSVARALGALLFLAALLGDLVAAGAFRDRRPLVLLLRVVGQRGAVGV